jgi:hypothetical protein
MRHEGGCTPDDVQAAIVGIDPLPSVTAVSKSNYTHEVNMFKTETEALSLLRE